MFDLNVKNIERIQDQETFELFLKAMEVDFKNNQEQWSNITIDAYFEAIAAWLSCQDEKAIENPANWSFIAKVMYIGKIYE